MNDNRIKVCHIVTRLELGGAQQNTLFTVGHLDRSRFLPSLITGKGGVLDEEARSLNDVQVLFSKHLIRSISIFSDIASLFELIVLIKKVKPAIVHTHSSKAGILGRWAAWFAGVPVIIHTFHGFGFNEFQKRPVKWAFILAERISAKISDRLIVVADEDRRKGLKYGIGTDDQYLLIRSGIDVQRFKQHTVDCGAKRKELGLSPDQRVVTTIGPFKPQKNLADFIRAAAIVAKEHPDCRFVIVGDGKQRPAIESLIKEKRLEGKVILAGWRRDCADILGITDVFAMTSLWEGLPRSILEAMCMSLPVVANSIDGVREIVKHNETGFLTEPFAVQKTAEHISFLLARPEAAKTMGKRGQELIGRQFDINYMVRQQEELYLGLLK